MRLIDEKAIERFKRNPFSMGMLLRRIRKQPIIKAEAVGRAKWDISGQYTFGGGAKAIVCTNAVASGERKFLRREKKQKRR